MANRMTALDVPKPMGSLLGAIPTPRPNAHTCFACRVSRIEFPGVCQDCAEKQFKEEFDAALEPAIKSIPSLWQWANPADPEHSAMAAQCIDEWPRVVRELLDVQRAIVAGNGPRVVVFYGPEGQRGKTSSACLLLRWLIERGRFDKMAPDERLAAMRHDLSAPVLAPPSHRGLARRIANARGARYVRSQDLQCKTDFVLPEIEKARRIAIGSPVVVIDDVGRELNSANANSFDLPGLIDGTNQVVHSRNERPEALTIYTTWLSRAKMHSYYGGGTTERLYKNGVVICVGPNARREDT